MILSEGYNTITMNNRLNDFIPKYKQRFGQSGDPNIYGKFDINGIYRGDDIFHSNNNRRGKRKKYKKNNSSDDDDDDDYSKEESNNTSRNSSDDEDDEDDESSGEYPPGYFDQAIIQTSLQTHHSQCNLIGHDKKYNSFYCNECKILKKENKILGCCVMNNNNNNEVNINQEEKNRKFKEMRETLDDIRSVLSHPSSYKDGNLYIEMIRKILDKNEEIPSLSTALQSLSSPSPLLLLPSNKLENHKRKKILHHKPENTNNVIVNKKKRKLIHNEEEDEEYFFIKNHRNNNNNNNNNNDIEEEFMKGNTLSLIRNNINNKLHIKQLNNDIDKEYRLQIGSTDCYHCKLCDPLKLKDIRITCWEGHCLLNIHKQRRENDIEEKKIKGL